MSKNRITYSFICNLKDLPGYKVYYQVIGWTIRDHKEVLLCEDGTTLEIDLEKLKEMISDKDFLQFNYNDYMEELWYFGSPVKNVKRCPI